MALFAHWHYLRTALFAQPIAEGKRLSEAGRRARVEQLVGAVCDCTVTRFVDET